MTPRPMVQAFAEVMEERLLANEDKGGWDLDGPLWLHGRLMQQATDLFHELRQCFGSPPHVAMDGARRSRIRRKAANVANFAMMIVDACGGFDERDHHATAKETK